MQKTANLRYNFTYIIRGRLSYKIMKLNILRILVEKEIIVCF